MRKREENEERIAGKEEQEKGAKGKRKWERKWLIRIGKKEIMERNGYGCEAGREKKERKRERREKKQENKE